jgi:hypothetical protein
MNKKVLFFPLCFAAVITIFSSCIKQDDVVFNDNVAEFDAASYNVVFGALTYPLIVRHPTPGRAIITADSFITRRSGAVSFRVNLLGKQRSTPTTVSYQVFAVGAAVGSSITYTAPVSGTLTTFDAVSGTHYGTISGTVTIPANSSFGTITIPVLNTGTSTNTTALLGLELTQGGEVPPSENYKKIVFAISQK